MPEKSSTSALEWLSFVAGLLREGIAVYAQFQRDGNHAATKAEVISVLEGLNPGDANWTTTLAALKEQGA